MAKPQKNYAAWHIDASEFSDAWPVDKKLDFFARYAVLAPSGHNTQPWLFVHEKDGLLLTVNPARELPFSGALAAEPYVSLGACLEVFTLAAKGLGYDIHVEYLFDNKTIARLSIGRKVKPSSELLTAITERVSNRSLYKEEVPPQNVLDAIATHPLQHVTLRMVTDKKDISYLAEKTLEATAEIMTEQEFRNELSKWVRNNITKQHDGMPGFVQGMPTPPSLLAKHVVRRFDISKTQAKLDAKRVSHSPVLAIICAQSDEPIAYLEVGRLYARLCIQAIQEGVASSGVGAAVISPTTKKAIAKRFELPTLPTAMLRLGHATQKARHTPRWPVEQVSK